MCLAEAHIAYVPLDPGNCWPRDFTQAPPRAWRPCTSTTRPTRLPSPSLTGAFEETSPRPDHRRAIVHNFASCELVFDGREPKSFLATPGAKEVSVELFSMSKSYRMAGWRVGFVVGNAEIVERINLLTVKRHN